jgi:hypothetical protein
MADSHPPDPRHKGGRLRLFSLIAATFFMVSGGPYGIEDTLGGPGYLGALLILAIVPFVLGYSQPSPFDKLRAGFSGLIASCPSS